MSYLVVSTSLNPASRSRLLCRAAHAALEARGVEVELLDLQEHPLPACDGSSCYEDPRVSAVTEELGRARGILLGVPIYCFDVAPAARNLVALTGREAWTGKVAGFLCAAGGQGSYMSVMPLAASLMLDFRTLIVPRFVYATREAFDGEAVADPEVARRVDELAGELVRLTEALA